MEIGMKSKMQETEQDKFGLRFFSFEEGIARGEEKEMA
jgi:hypothetical protein